MRSWASRIGGLGAAALLCAGCLGDFQKVDDRLPVQGSAGSGTPADSPKGAKAEGGACCATANGSAGCAGSSVEACVCAADMYCCTSEWDAACVAEITELACGSCPGAEEGAAGGDGAQCSVDADCSEEVPRCAEGACVECLGDPDCALLDPEGPPHCVEGSCAMCVTDADCSGGTTCIAGDCA